jgi:hypothetical protein
MGDLQGQSLNQISIAFCIKGILGWRLLAFVIVPHQVEHSFYLYT